MASSAQAKPVESQVARLLVRGRYVLLAIALLLGIVSHQFSGEMSFDRSIESMFRADDRLLQDFQKLKRIFEGDEILLVAYRDPQLMNPDRTGIMRLQIASELLREIDGVKDVISLAEIDAMLRKQAGGDRDSTEAGLSGITDPDQPLATRLKDLFAGYTHSRDEKIAALICILDEPDSGTADHEAVIGGIRNGLKRLRLTETDFPETMLIGEPVMIADSFQMIEQDGVRLRWSSSILMVTAIFCFFRSVRWMLIPLVVVQYSLLLTRATLYWSGLQLTMVSSMLDAIVTVIGVATTVHIIVRYRNARREDLDRKQSMTRALSLLVVPIAWAIATDSAGFLALWFSQLGPVRDFAIMMATGSLMVLVSTLLLVPGLSLLRLPRRLSFLDNDPSGKRTETFLDTNLQLPLRIARRYPVAMSVIMLTGSLAVACGVMFNEVESDFTQNFRDDSEIVRSYEFVESQMGGAGVWDVVIPAPEKITHEYLKRVEKLERRLRTEVVVETENGEEPGLSKVISLADIVSSALPVDVEKVPFGRDGIVTATVSGMRLMMPNYFETVYAADLQSGQASGTKRYFLRIMLRSKERRSTEQKKQVINQVLWICKEEIGEPDSNAGEVFVTGHHVLIANMIDSVIRDQWVTFAIAIGVIFVMLLIATRSLRYALIAMIPNVVPILMVLGTLGWIGEKVNIGVAMIAAVSVGLSVDSSIHYILSFKRSLAGGADIREALDGVQNRVGRALVFATLAIVLGFATLCVSNFMPIVYFGLLSVMAMIGGLAGNLVILPLLLQMPVGDYRSTDSNAPG